MNLRVLSCLICIFICYTSCETEKDKLKKAREVVTTFLSNANVENYEVMNKLYPEFSKVGKYYKVSDFRMTNSSIDANGKATITGKSFVGDLLFVLEKVNGEYSITRSKGLSPAFKSNLYQFCKAIGCSSKETSDLDVSNICNSKEDEFNVLVYQIQNDIEDKFKILNHTLTLAGGNYGLNSYLSGNISVINNSRFTIPRYAYNVYYEFFDSEKNLLFTKEETSNFEAIPYGQGKTISLFETNTNGFAKVKAKLKITSTDFIEEIIAKNASGVNCNNKFQFL